MAETTASPGAAAGAAEQPSLRRVMGPGLLLLFVVGDILGTGIYALTGQVAARRSRSLHTQGVRRPFPHIHRRVHRGVLGHHLGVNGVEGVCCEPG